MNGDVGVNGRRALYLVVSANEHVPECVSLLLTICTGIIVMERALNTIHAKCQLVIVSTRVLHAKITSIFIHPNHFRIFSIFGMESVERMV